MEASQGAGRDLNVGDEGKELGKASVSMWLVGSRGQRELLEGGYRCEEGRAGREAREM